MGIFIALTGTGGDTLFWVVSVLVCKGGCDGVLVGGAVLGMWCNARGSCIVAFKIGVCVTFDNCGTIDGGHHSGSPIGCVSGMTAVDFRSGCSDVPASNKMGTSGTCCFRMRF